MPTCPSCHSRVKKKATVCPRCFAALAPAHSATSAGAAPATQTGAPAAPPATAATPAGTPQNAVPTLTVQPGAPSAFSLAEAFIALDDAQDAAQDIAAVPKSVASPFAATGAQTPTDIGTPATAPGSESPAGMPSAPSAAPPRPLYKTDATGAPVLPGAPPQAPLSGGSFTAGRSLPYGPASPNGMAPQPKAAPAGQRQNAPAPGQSSSFTPLPNPVYPGAGGRYYPPTLQRAHVAHPPRAKRKTARAPLAFLVGGVIGVLVIVVIMLNAYSNRKQPAAFVPPTHAVVPEIVVAVNPVPALSAGTPADTLEIARAGLSATRPVLLHEYSAPEETAFLLPDGSLYPVGAQVTQYTSTADGAAFAYIKRPDQKNYANSGQELHLYQNGADTLVATAVDTYWLAPATGNLYYICTTNFTSTLFLYADGQETQLAENASYFAVSPNEESLLISIDTIVYLARRGEAPVPVAGGDYSLRPLSVSNDGATLFLQETYPPASSYLVTCLRVAPATGQVQNQQFLLLEKGDTLRKLYISWSGNQAVVQTDAKLLRCTKEEGFAQLGEGEGVLYAPNLSIDSYTSGEVIPCLVEDFSTILYSTTAYEESGRVKTLYLWSAQNGAQMVAEDIGEYPPVVNPTGTRFVYRAGNQLCLARIQNGAVGGQESLATDVVQFAASADLAHIYYSDFDALYHRVSTGETQKIDKYTFHFVISADGTRCVYDTSLAGTKDNALWLYTAGAGSEKLSFAANLSAEAVGNTGWALYQTTTRDGEDYIRTLWLYTPESGTPQPLNNKTIRYS